MKSDIEYLFYQSMNLVDQRTGKFYWMQIYEYAVAGINDWEISPDTIF